jgi:hypothetical protein
MKPPSLGSASNPEHHIHSVSHDHNTAIFSKKKNAYKILHMN